MKLIILFCAMCIITSCVSTYHSTVGPDDRFFVIKDKTGTIVSEVDAYNGYICDMALSSLWGQVGPNATKFADCNRVSAADQLPYEITVKSKVSGLVGKLYFRTMQICEDTIKMPNPNDEVLDTCHKK